MSTNDNNQIISYLTLRKWIGILGISMPAILLLGTFTIGHCTHLQDSISHYYYTRMGDVFVGILCAVALFLLSYKGYDSIDSISSKIAGVFALMVAFFATTPNQDIQCTMFELDSNRAREVVHFVSAALFFLTLAFISFFLFTRSQGLKTNRKVTRNMVYRTCGIVIVVSIGLVFVYHSIPFLKNKLACYKPVFWLEWIALIAFGTSWLVKGKLVLEDK
jgi:hypothetical protein